MLPLIQPDLRQPRVIVVDDPAGSSREGVGGSLAEHVAHVRTRRDLQVPAAHPHLDPGFINVCAGGDWVKLMIKYCHLYVDEFTVCNWKGIGLLIEGFKSLFGRFLFALYF